jgi:hypothetical protein
MKMKRRSATVLVTLVAMVGMIIAAPASATAQELEGVTGAIEGTLDGDPFEGFVEITEFNLDGDQLMVDGRITDAAGETLQAFEDVAASLHRPQQQRCDILFLDLHGLNLDVLGLNVDLSQVVLDIYAVPGAGNLLGNLLCAVAGLLDGPGQGGGILNAINNLLDRVNDILDGLFG